MRGLSSWKDYSIQKLIEVAVILFPGISNEAIARLLSYFMRLDRSKKYRYIVAAVQDMLLKNHPSIPLVRKAMHDLSVNSKRMIIRNFFINSIFTGISKRYEYERQHGFLPPYFFVLSPTMHCNLRCYGCYAFKYSRDALSFAEVDRILRQAKEMGIYFVTISGGEPFVRKDLLRIFACHHDMFFQVYTNGTLINADVARQLTRLGNVALAISVEGFEEHTDERRGEGTYRRVMQSMAQLRRQGVLFGFSSVPTQRNHEVLCSDEFIDAMVASGCYFGWFFQYIPVGKDPDLSLMMTPRQRHQFRQDLARVRSKKPIFLADFWNDGLYVDGCMAGGQTYFHINNEGYVEPCVFIHMAVDNIKEKSLGEVLNSEFFKYIRKQHPVTDNHLRPCMIIDEPKVLRDVYQRFNPIPTHEGAESIVTSLNTISHLDWYSQTYKQLADAALARLQCNGRLCRPLR